MAVARFAVDYAGDARVRYVHVHTHACTYERSERPRTHVNNRIACVQTLYTVGVCAPKHISIAITGNFVNGGATNDQCPLTFIYRFYVRFTGRRSRAVSSRVSGHVFPGH